MFDDNEPLAPSSSTAIVALAPAAVDPEWQAILHVSNQVVLYNPTSHAISIRTHSRLTTPAPSAVARTTGERCPYCHRSMPAGLRGERVVDGSLDSAYLDELEGHSWTRASNYFQLLEIANETSSRPSTPPSSSFPTTSTSRNTSTRTAPSSRSTAASTTAFHAENMAEGYFRAFFQEECRLGMGANGSVYLCQVCPCIVPSP